MILKIENPVMCKYHSAVITRVIPLQVWECEVTSNNRTDTMYTPF